MSRSSIIVSHFLAADNSKPTALGWKPWHFYFTIVKYSMSAGLAQATASILVIWTWLRRTLGIQFAHGLAVSGLLPKFE
jgi:hypothetical protein